MKISDYYAFLVIALALVPAFHSVLEPAYQRMLEGPFGGDARLTAVVSTFVTSTGVYWLYSLALTGVDLGWWGTWLRARKIQPMVDVTTGDVVKAVRNVLRNQLLVSLPWGAFVVYVASPARAQMWGGSGDDLASGQYSAPFPAWSTILRDLVVFVLVEEVLFFYLHMLGHHPKVYKYFHKQHHEFTAPFGWCAIYSGATEMLANNLAVSAGPWLMQSHVATVNLWVFFAILNTVNAHSGYELPGFPSPRVHDFHHFAFTENLGFLGLLDSLHGTNTRFVKLEAERLQAAAA